METVEVVIRLPKDLYEGIECRNGELETEYVCDELMKAVDNGTPLPKNHGDLIDKDKLWDAYQDMGQDFYQALDCVSAIVEADGEVENDNTRGIRAFKG